jgi:hypothetical protein
MDRGQVFLRNAGTQKWYAGPNRWADTCAEAREFQSVDEAAAFGSGLGVKDMKAVVHFRSGEGDLVLPLRKKGP